MNIAYIGKFRRIHDEEGIARALEAEGHNVTRIQEDELVYIEQVVQSAPDLILFAKLQTPPVFNDNLIKYAKREGIKTVCYVPDLYWGLPRQSSIIGKEHMFQADHVCTPDGSNEEKWIGAGIKHHVVRQGIHEEFIKRGNKIDAPEIVFVGQTNPLYPYREKLLNFLKQAYGDRFRHYGEHNSNHVRGWDLNDLYESAKIVIGDSVFSPHYWSNRIYETIGRGGFIIHPMVAGLEREYKPYTHFVPYSIGDFAGLKEKINFYLTHDKERDAIRLAGMEHTRKHHTLNHRVKQLLECVK